MSIRDEETRTPDVGALEVMLDHAILEGAELRLPHFVLLLRAAQLELMSRLGPGGDCAQCATDARHGEIASLAPPGERLDAFISFPQDR